MGEEGGRLRRTTHFPRGNQGDGNTSRRSTGSVQSRRFSGTALQATPSSPCARRGTSQPEWYMWGRNGTLKEKAVGVVFGLSKKLFGRTCVVDVWPILDKYAGELGVLGPRDQTLTVCSSCCICMSSLGSSVRCREHSRCGSRSLGPFRRCQQERYQCYTQMRMPALERRGGSRGAAY
eukprot:4510096-Alexandrium_andersonii.AAC.1